MEWNGRSLRGLTFEDVYDIIFESKSDPQVELKVERPVSRTDLNAGMSEQLEIEGFRLLIFCNLFHLIQNVHIDVQSIIHIEARTCITSHMPW